MFLLSIPLALPCGGLFTEEGGQAMSDAQVAVFSPGERQVKVTYRIRFSGDTEEFGWVIPIPGDLLDFADGSCDAVETLVDGTAPRTVRYQEDAGTGCGGGGGKGADDTGAMDDTGSTGGGSVGVVEIGSSFAYDYVVLDATDGDALLGWLDEHGFDVGPSGDVIETYVAEGGWQWVAITANNGEGRLDDRELPPVTLTYSGTRMVWPGRMLSSSTARLEHTVLVVQSPKTATITGGWTEEFRDTVRNRDARLLELDWTTIRRELGEERAFARTYSGWLNDEWVTAFETEAPPSAYTADVELGLLDDAVFSETILTDEPASKGCASLAPLLLLCAPLLRRRS